MAVILDAKGITKRFGGLTALSTLDFELEEGTIASIIGPNGAGKTTFFNVFTGIYVPEEGAVTFRGTPVLGKRPDQITALGICRTFQNIRLFANMTAAENVLVGMHSRIPLRFWDVLSRNPRWQRAERTLWAQGIELLDVVGLRAKANELARNLPYGDQRRLEIGRALASRPRLNAYILSWDFALLFALEREWLTELKLTSRMQQRLKFQLDDRHPVGASHHQKLIVVDDAVGFVSGFDLTFNRWDTPEHLPGDARRRNPDGTAYAPFHDLGVVVSGRAAGALGGHDMDSRTADRRQGPAARYSLPTL